MTMRVPARVNGSWWLALAVALAYFVPALFLLGDYGPTYDAIRGDYPYGERLLGYLETGDERFLELRAREPAPKLRQPHPNFDVGRFCSEWAFPVGSLLSGASCRLFWTELDWLPALSAHFLPSVVLATVLIFVVSAFAHARWGALAGVVAGGALFLTPSFFGHSFNNPKDIPECCFYSCAVLAGFLALERGDRRLWLAAGAATGLALAQKANGLFLPVQLALFLAGVHAHARRRQVPLPRFKLSDFAATSATFLVAYYGASPPFWSQPIEGPRRWLGEMIQAGNFAARTGGTWSGSRISFDAPWSVLTMVPIAFLLLAAVGVLRPGLGFRMRWFLLVSIGVPIGRHVIPGMRNYEGIRHFLEFLPFLSLAAGAGAAWLAEKSRQLASLPRAASSAVGLLVLLVLGLQVRAVIAAHPNQVTLTNALVAKPMVDAWANSYWQGLGWMSRHAEQDAQLLVPSLGFIALASAPVRLREDIELLIEPPRGLQGQQAYVMLRPNLPSDLVGLELPAPAFEVRVKGHAVLHIYRLEPDGEAFVASWRGRIEVAKVTREVKAFLRRTPGLLRTFGPANRALSPEQKRSLLRESLPEELYRKLEEARQQPDQLFGEDEGDDQEASD